MKPMSMQKFLLIGSIGMFTFPTYAASLPPWMVKPQTELTHAECLAAMVHDSNFWWSRGSCHMKFIRYAAGVALKDTKADEDPSAIMEKGKIFFNITQYRSREGLYCGHGDFCYPAKDIKLLGSVLTGPYMDGQDDGFQGVGSSCELIIADKANIIAAGAQSLFQDCH